MAPRENGLDYDGIVSGPTIYAYVLGNPVRLSDPYGLRPLSAGEKACLVPYIPQVDLDNADLHDDGTPWWTKSNADGVTVGNDIYFKTGVYDSTTPAGIALLGHELLHVGQYRTGMTVFSYLAEAAQNGDTLGNKYEKPAYELQNKIQQELSAAYGSKVPCGCSQ